VSALCPVDFCIYSYSQLKNDGSSTLETPPNHQLFDNTATKVSPVLQRRLDQNKASAAPAAPVINFNIGPEIIDLFRPGTHEPVPAPAPPYQGPPLPTATVPVYDLQCPTLLQPNRKAGFDMAIDEFCKVYQLSDSITKKLTENSYTYARMLRFVTIEEVRQMDFRLGEIAALRDAVDQWSVIA
jgi:hypothetical protein